MLRIEALWLCAQPVDMRTGAERLLAAVVSTLGEARAHHGYLFANARSSRIKLLVHGVSRTRTRVRGRRPPEVGLQEQASNRPVLLRSKGVVVSDWEKSP